MLTTKINNKKIVLYSSIKELPIDRYKGFQNYILQDSGIGNDMSSIDKRLQNAIVFLSNNHTDDAKEELTNLRYSFFSMINGIDYKSKSFACIIKEIDGIALNDISPEGLDNVLLLLQEIGTTNEQIENLWNDVKKNLIMN